GVRAGLARAAAGGGRGGAGEGAVLSEERADARPGVRPAGAAGARARPRHHAPHRRRPRLRLSPLAGPHQPEVLSTWTGLVCTLLRKGRRQGQLDPLPPAAGPGGEFATPGEQVANSPCPLSRCDGSTWVTPRGEFATSPLVPGPGGGA